MHSSSWNFNSHQCLNDMIPFLKPFDTWSPPMTRSRRKGIIAQKSTRFIGCLKNRNFLGEQMNLWFCVTKSLGNFEKKRLDRFEVGQKNLMQYSTRKKRTAPFSEMLHILMLAVATLDGDECGSNLQRPWPERPPGKVGVALSPPLSGTLQRSSHSEG